MSPGALADLIVALHFGFVLFVVLGGFLVLRWWRVAWVHLPAAIWGAWIEFTGRLCPLTPLENHYRRLGGQAGYPGGFIEHYILPVLYPHGLTRGVQIALGVIVVTLNAGLYAWALSRRRRRNVSFGQ